MAPLLHFRKVSYLENASKNLNHLYPFPEQYAQAPETTTSEATEQSEEDDAIGTVSLSSIEDVGTKLGQHIIGLTPLTVTVPEQCCSEDHEPGVGDEEPTALLKQRFIFNDEITVEQFLRNSNAAVLDFVRFECGEEIGDN